jgi:hypothetical protein
MTIQQLARKQREALEDLYCLIGDVLGYEEMDGSPCPVPTRPPEVRALIGERIPPRPDPAPFIPIGRGR